MRRLLISASVLALLTHAAMAQQSRDMGNGEYVVYFALNSSTLDAAAARIIELAAADYRQTGSARVTLRGHADTSGNADYNQVLSERRARAVADELNRLGVPSGAIASEALGQSDLAVPTGDGVREQANRRVEIAVDRPAAEPAPAPMASAAAPPPSPPPPAEPENRGLFSLGAFYGYNMLDEGDNEGEDSSQNSDKSSHLGGANLSFDYAVARWMSLGLEQAVFYNFGTDSDGVGGRSAAGLDFLLGRGSMIPYIGGNIGYIYGSGIKDDAFAGPEIGLAIGPLNAKVAYDMPFGRSADKGIISTTIGVGVRF